MTRDLTIDRYADSAVRAFCGNYGDEVMDEHLPKSLEEYAFEFMDSVRERHPGEEDIAFKHELGFYAFVDWMATAHPVLAGRASSMECSWVDDEIWIDADWTDFTPYPKPD